MSVRFDPDLCFSTVTHLTCNCHFLKIANLISFLKLFIAHSLSGFTITSKFFCPV